MAALFFYEVLQPTRKVINIFNQNNPTSSLTVYFDEISKNLKLRCPMNHMTVMFKKSEVDRAGGYQDWYHNEDYYLWIRMYLKNNIFGNLKNSLVKVRIDDKMFLRRAGWKYFKSELGIQKLLLKNKITTVIEFLYNVSIRLVIQLLIPNCFRKWIFLKLIRK